MMMIQSDSYVSWLLFHLKGSRNKLTEWTFYKGGGDGEEAAAGSSNIKEVVCAFKVWLREGHEIPGK